jgi:CRISPR-associated endonuclease Csn1
MERMMESRHKDNEKALEEIRGLGISNPSGFDILKYKLWKEQDCKCAYSGETIPIERLFEDSYCQVDHVIPYSQSMDDSYNNKVLVLTKENQEKRNETPFQ